MQATRYPQFLNQKTADALALMLNLDIEEVPRRIQECLRMHDRRLMENSTIDRFWNELCTLAVEIGSTGGKAPRTRERREASGLVEAVPLSSRSNQMDFTDTEEF